MREYMNIKSTKVQKLTSIAQKDSELEYNDTYQLTGLECLELIIRTNTTTHAMQTKIIEKMKPCQID